MTIDYLTVLSPLCEKPAGHCDSAGCDNDLTVTARPNEADPKQIIVRSLPSLAKAVKDIQRSNNVLIRGKPKEGGSNVWANRLCDRFESAPRRWCLIDVDAIDLPREYEDISKFTTEVLLYTLDFLPPEFQDTHFWYQFYPGTGIGRCKFRVQLWYWLDRMVADAEMKTWLRDCPVDLRLYHAIQFHLMPRSVDAFERVDPLIDRTGYFLAGAVDIVPVPSDLDRPVASCH